MSCPLSQNCPRLELKAIHLTVQFASGGRTSGRTSSGREFCCTVLHNFGQFLSRLYRCARKSRQIPKAAFIAAEPYNEQYCTGCTKFKNSSRLLGFLDSRPYRPVEFSASDWHEKRGAGSGSTAK
eukprot:Gb_22173 [translate_table: standard]